MCRRFSEKAVCSATSIWLIPGIPSLRQARGSGYGPFQTFSAQEQADLGLQVMAKDLGAFPLTLYGVSDPEIFAEQFNQSRYLSAAISAICLLICCLFILH